MPRRYKVSGRYGGVPTSGAENEGMQASGLIVQRRSYLWQVVRERHAAYEQACGDVEVGPELAARALEVGEQTGDKLLRDIGRVYLEIAAAGGANQSAEAA